MQKILIVKLLFYKITFFKSALKNVLIPLLILERKHSQNLDNKIFQVILTFSRAVKPLHIVGQKEIHISEILISL